MSDLEVEAKPKRNWKKLFTWVCLIIIGAGVAGLLMWQGFFRTALAETSYNSVYDVWGGDPRSRCAAVQSEDHGIVYQCAPDPHLSPTDTVRFYAGQCDSSTSGVPDLVMLDIPVAALDKIDPQVKEGGRGSIQVTYRPRILGVFGSDQVLKVESTPENSSCVTGSGY